jgi:hypothetical protein
MGSGSADLGPVDVPHQDASLETTQTTKPADTTTPALGRPNAPARVLRRHYEWLSNGNYSGAFHLMSSSYRALNPNWASERANARPHVNVTELGPSTISGRVAYVQIRFYGRDTYDTGKSDTRCRRFTGRAQMIKEGSSWRYNPAGTRYNPPSVLPSSLNVCNQ